MSDTDGPQTFEMPGRKEFLDEMLFSVRCGHGSTDIAMQPDEIDRALAEVAYACESLDELWEACVDVRLQLRLLCNSVYRIDGHARYKRRLRQFACDLVRIVEPAYHSSLELAERDAREAVPDEDLRTNYERLCGRVKYGNALGMMRGLISADELRSSTRWLPCEASQVCADSAAEAVAANVIRNARDTWTRVVAAVSPDAAGLPRPAESQIETRMAALLIIALRYYVGKPFRPLAAVSVVGRLPGCEQGGVL